MKTKRFSKWSKVWAVLLAAVLAFGLSGCGAGTGSGSRALRTSPRKVNAMIHSTSFVYFIIGSPFVILNITADMYLPQ